MIHGPPFEGEALLEAVNAEMIAFHKRYYGRAPVNTRTQLLEGELLATIMGGVYTDVEKTLLELQRATIVNEARSAFQDAMGDRLIRTVQRLSGRRVLLFFSKAHVAPDMQIELFLLGAALPRTGEAAAAS